MSATLDGKDPALEPWCAGYGPVPAEYMLVGISAGRLGAIKTQVPFTKGPSGRLLQRCLGRLGLSESDEFSVRPRLVRCYLTNFVKGVCLTEGGLNRLPTEPEWEHWSRPMMQEVNTVHPRVVVALGRAVWDHLLRLEVFEQPFFSSYTTDIRVRAVNHPRFYESHGALAGGRWFERMVGDYRRALA
jgi:uracil-DNA glycosylase family 4